MRTIVGYPVENFSHSADVLFSEEEYEGISSCVELWREIRPEETCDVGRTLEGEIVWVKKVVSSEPFSQKVTYIPAKHNESEHVTEFEHEEPTSGFDLKAQALKIWESVSCRLLLIFSHMKNKRIVVIFSAVTALVAVLLWAGLPSLRADESQPTPEQPLSDSATTESLEAKEWVRNHILQGHIPEIVLHHNATAEDILITPVSSAGGAQLVDVSYPTVSGDEAITLLLQKTSDSWRLRHVYDLKT
jgi:hypothetical protein